MAKPRQAQGRGIVERVEELEENIHNGRGFFRIAAPRMVPFWQFASAFVAILMLILYLFERRQSEIAPCELHAGGRALIVEPVELHPEADYYSFYPGRPSMCCREVGILQGPTIGHSRDAIGPIRFWKIRVSLWERAWVASEVTDLAADTISFLVPVCQGAP